MQKSVSKLVEVSGAVWLRTAEDDESAGRKFDVLNWRYED